MVELHCVKDMIPVKAAPLLAAAVLGTFLSGCAAGGSLRKAAERAGIDFGTAVQAGDAYDPKVKDYIGKTFTMLVPENAMKWENIHPTKDFWNWSDMDALVRLAEEKDLTLRGHTFVWHQQNPPYVNALKGREEAVRLLTEQITAVMTRYKGKIREYDVANEVIADNGRMRDTLWLKTIGPDYLDIAFKAARDADPEALLFLNDYSNEYAGTPKGDAFYRLAKDLKERGVPLDGVGLQLHLMAEYALQGDALLRNIARFRELGLKVAFTEVDVRVKLPITPAAEAAQGKIFTELLRIAKTEPGAGTFMLWGWRDSRSWIPGTFPGYGSAHPVDAKGKEKPFFREFADILRKP